MRGRSRWRAGARRPVLSRCGPLGWQETRLGTAPCCRQGEGLTPRHPAAPRLTRRDNLHHDRSDRPVPRLRSSRPDTGYDGLLEVAPTPSAVAASPHSTDGTIKRGASEEHLASLP